MTEFEAEWVRCTPWIEAALAQVGKQYTIDDVLTEVIEQRAQFVPGKRAVVVTQILTYPRRKLLRIWLAGGELGEILEMLPSADAWALACGCDGIEVDGRKGWERVLAPHGFAPTRVVLTKDFN